MHRNRQGGRERNGGGGGRFRGNNTNIVGYGDGLLGEGPPVGGSLSYNDQSLLANQNQMNQLMLAQTLLQQQALAAGAGLGGAGDLGGLGGIGGIPALAGVGDMQFLQNQGYNGAGHISDRKRMAYGRDRNYDAKRRRHDSTGRSGDRDRSGTRDGGRGGEGRDRNRSSRWDSGRGNTKTGGKKDYDPAEPTEDDDGAKDKDSNLYCHVCNVSVYDEESFKRHLNGTKHEQRMNNVLTAHQMKSNQLKSRLKAEEHLRKIEGGGKGKEGRDPEFFCKICNNDLTVPWKYHSVSHIHRQRLLQVRRGCGWCGVHDFANFTEVLEHRETDKHKENAEIHGKKEDKKGSRSKDDRKEKKKEEEEDLTIPEYDAETPVGLKYIIPVTGFFCKLCHKFYNNENSAKGAHCQSEAHYQKFKAATEIKIEEREKRKAEEEAKKAAEEAEKETLKEEMDTSEAAGEDEDVKKENGDAEDDEDTEKEEDGDNDLAPNGEAKEEEADEIDNDLTDSDSPMDEAAAESLLDDTAANSSFDFAGGDMAQAHLDLQKQEELLQTKQPEEEVIADVSVPEVEDEAAAEDSQESEKSETGAEGEAAIVVESEEDEPAAKVTPAKRGTARRGRGRGRAKK